MKSKPEEIFKSEQDLQLHIQNETQAERISEYGSVGRFRNYSDLQTGAPGAQVKKG